MCCYVHPSVEVSNAIIFITQGTLEARKANAPREVGILSQSAARFHTEDFLQTACSDSCETERGRRVVRDETHKHFCTPEKSLLLHVLRSRHDIRGSLRRWMKSSLAPEAAGVAAETVDVGPPWVVGHPPSSRVERVLLVYVVIFFVSA